MSFYKILIVDEDEAIHDGLRELIGDNFDAEVLGCLDAESAIDACKQEVFSLIIFDPMCPSSFEGEEFIKEQRQFYSINKDTPAIMFTEDIEFVSRIPENYENIHPETKLGPISKIMNPMWQMLAKNSK